MIDILRLSKVLDRENELYFEWVLLQGHIKVGLNYYDGVLT